MKTLVKSREDRCIFDSNEYELKTIGVKLRFRTSLTYKDTIIYVKDKDKSGQSCEIPYNLLGLGLSLDDVLSEVESIESNFKPEKISSADEIGLFLSKVKD